MARLSDEFWYDKGVGDSMAEYEASTKLPQGPEDYVDKEADAKWPENWADTSETAEEWNARMSKGAEEMDKIRGVRKVPVPLKVEDVLSSTLPATRRQTGGSHYKDLAIQPVEYCVGNGLGMCESSVIKYVTRHSLKGGKEDLEKAIHMLELLIELKY